MKKTVLSTFLINLCQKLISRLLKNKEWPRNMGPQNFWKFKEFEPWANLRPFLINHTECIQFRRLFFVITRLGPWERKDKLLKRKDELLPSIRFFFIFRSKFIVSKRRDAETMWEFFSSAWLNLFFKLRDNHKRYGFTYWLKNVAHKNLHNICYINII